MTEAEVVANMVTIVVVGRFAITVAAWVRRSMEKTNRRVADRMDELVAKYVREMEVEGRKTDREDPAVLTGNLR